MTKAEMREQIERAMSEFKGKIQRTEKVGGKENLSRYSANYRAGSSQLRLGKNATGKTCMAETNNRLAVWDL